MCQQRQHKEAQLYINKVCNHEGTERGIYMVNASFMTHELVSLLMAMVFTKINISSLITVWTHVRLDAAREYKHAAGEFTLGCSHTHIVKWKAEPVSELQI